MININLFYSLQRTRKQTQSDVEAAAAVVAAAALSAVGVAVR